MRATTSKRQQLPSRAAAQNRNSTTAYSPPCLDHGVCSRWNEEENARSFQILRRSRPARRLRSQRQLKLARGVWQCKHAPYVQKTFAMASTCGSFPADTSTIHHASTHGFWDLRRHARYAASISARGRQATLLQNPRGWRSRLRLQSRKVRAGLCLPAADRLPTKDALDNCFSSY